MKKKSKRSKQAKKSKESLEGNWYDHFLDKPWYRGYDAGGKGVGLAYMGEGLYLTWDRGVAEAFARLAVEASEKEPAKLGVFRIKPNLKLLDNRSTPMSEIKKSLGVNPWDKIDNKLFSKILSFHIKRLGYDGAIDSNPADGLMLLDPKNAEPVEEIILE